MPASITATPTGGVATVDVFRFDIAGTNPNKGGAPDPTKYPVRDEIRYYLAYELGGTEYGRSQVFGTSPDGAFQINSMILPWAGTWTIHLYDTADSSIATTTVVTTEAPDPVGIAEIGDYAAGTPA